ncbi:sulfite exporter TauE/SafE family protein [Defluviimonas sp. WL0050]|uniref:Probable membrane transporter protein n=1 Tax=Albidovulum litorale TaxID=2984134 RepID=A0ABT2ZKA7_9RHOB|nr:sulfite exporter TauE/SafE family protein [Defluviimonas sp. WL0050]MCV2871568.1 sulfite exporter TauE/SafE family protein [Defluviimonas sp. WL0050]
MEGGLFWTVAVIAASLVGLSKGGLPVVGMLGVPVLALAISPVTAAGLLLPVYVASDMIGLIAYRRAFDRRVLAILAPAAVLGIGLGWVTAAMVPERLVTGIVGAIGVAFAVSLLLRLRPEGQVRHARVGSGLFWGALTGYTSFVSHAGAPPYQVYVLPLKLDKTTFAGTTTVFFAFVNAVKLVPYWALGQLFPGNLKIAAVLAPPAIIAVLAGVWLVKVLPEVLFFRLVTWALLAVSLKHLWSAVAG